jgi:hypothetical protein
MSPTDVKPSTRLLRAAAAERDEIVRQRERALGARTKLLAELAKLDAALAQLDERELLLDRLAPSSSVVQVFSTQDVESHVSAEPDNAAAAALRGGVVMVPFAVRTADSRAAAGASALQRENGKHGTPPSTTSTPGLTPLRGPAIRETAVRLLLERGVSIERIHYREWFELVRDAGFEVIGKDPHAVFLTQITRSPVVRKTTEGGIYALDLDAPIRLRLEITRLQADLREVMGGAPAPQKLGAVRERREALMSAIGQVERALEEAERVLGRGEVAAPARVAAV